MSKRKEAVVARGANGAVQVLYEQDYGQDACPRCGGLMVIDQSLDLALEALDEAGHHDALGRRCVQCGEVIDSVILRNRRNATTLLNAGC